MQMRGLGSASFLMDSNVAIRGILSDLMAYQNFHPGKRNQAYEN